MSKIPESEVTDHLFIKLIANCPQCKDEEIHLYKMNGINLCAVCGYYEVKQPIGGIIEKIRPMKVSQRFKGNKKSDSFRNRRF